VLEIQQFVTEETAVPGSRIPSSSGEVPPSTQIFIGKPTNTGVSVLSPVVQSTDIKRLSPKVPPGVQVKV
jgi:hypothetical protein